MTPAEIRRLGPADASVLDRVDEDVFDHPIDAHHLGRYLADPGHLMIVAIADGVVVGQCRGTVLRHPDGPPELFIENLGVAPGHRRRGIGRQLMAAMLDWGREQECKEAWIGTETDNAPALALYRRLGPKTDEPFVLFEYDL